MLSFGYSFSHGLSGKCTAWDGLMSRKAYDTCNSSDTTWKPKVSRRLSLSICSASVVGNFPVLFLPAPYWGPCHRFKCPWYLFSSCFPAYILLLPLQRYVLFCHHWLVLSSLFYTSHGYFEISTSKIILVLVVEVDDGREWAGVYVGMLLGLLPDLPPLPYLSLLSFFCKRLSLVTELGLNSA